MLVIMMIVMMVMNMTSVMGMNVMMLKRHSDEGDECDGSTGVG